MQREPGKNCRILDSFFKTRVSKSVKNVNANSTAGVRVNELAFQRQPGRMNHKL